MILIFTSGISSSDEYFKTLDTKYKIDIRDIVLNYKREFPNQKKHKYELVRDWIDEHKNNEILLVGNTLSTVDDYLKLKTLLLNSSIVISKIYIKLGDLSKYKELYSKHSNWVDYSLEFVKSKEDERNIELKKLYDILLKDGINTTYVK